MWGTSFWWFLPAVGMLLCLVLMVVMAFFCLRRGCGCMHGTGKP
jgi:hypothetical protein